MWSQTGLVKATSMIYVDQWKPSSGEVRPSTNLQMGLFHFFAGTNQKILNLSSCHNLIFYTGRIQHFIPFLLFSSLYFFILKLDTVLYAIVFRPELWIELPFCIRYDRQNCQEAPHSASCSCPPVEKKFLANALLFILHHFSKIFENPLGPAADLWLSFFLLMKLTISFVTHCEPQSSRLKCCRQKKELFRDGLETAF